MVQGQGPASCRGAAVEPKSDAASSAGGGFLPRQYSQGLLRGVMGEAGYTGKDIHGSLLAFIYSRAQHRPRWAGLVAACGPGPDLASCSVGSFPQCPTPLTGWQEDGISPWDILLCPGRKVDFPTPVSLRVFLFPWALLLSGVAPREWTEYL